MLRILRVSIIPCFTLSDCANHDFCNSFVGGRMADDVNYLREKFFVGKVLLTLTCTIHFQKSRMRET